MNLEILAYLSLIIVLTFLLVKSADLIEDAFVFLAKQTGVSEFVIGFVILSLVSSLPEFSIAINSNNTIPELSISNLIGASLVLLTLVIGLTIIKFGDIDFKGKFNEKEIIAGLVVILMSVITLADGTLAFWEGLSLIAGYLIYAYHIYVIFKVKPKIETPEKYTMVPAKKVVQMLTKSVVGAFLILISSSLLVDSIRELASPERFNVPESLVGLFVLGIGTNLPEITILVRARKAGYKKLALGNFIGSACVNSLILGILAVMTQGVTIKDFDRMIPVLVILTVVIFAFILLSWTGRKITKREAAVLISFYFVFIGVEFFLAFVA